MIEATVLLLTFTDQQKWGFSGKTGIDLTSMADLDDNWYSPLCQVFKQVIRYDLYRSANISGICAVNREIIDIIDTYRPKYVIYPCNFSSIVTEATLVAIRQTGAIVVSYFFDDDVYFETKSRWMAPYMDYCVTQVRARVADYERLGVRCILAAPIPLNPSIFHKLDERKIHDVSFVGSLRSNRQTYISDIASHGIAVTNFGSHSFDQKLHYSQMVKIYNQSRINLNFSLNDVLGYSAKQLKGRVFEVCLSGGFLLTEDAVDLEKYFEIGREVVTFETAIEAAEKIRYYLEHVDEREEIAARGYSRAQKQYAGQEVIRKVFLAIEEDLLRRGRPELVPPDSGVNTLRQSDAEQYYLWAQALLKSPSPLRNAWRETAELVLATNPEHTGARLMLRRRGKWGNPKPIISGLRLAPQSFLLNALRRMKRSLRPVMTILENRPRRVFHPSSAIRIHPSLLHLGGKITVGKNSTLYIGAGVKIDGDIYVGDGCRVSIHKDSSFNNVTFDIQNNSIVEIGEGAIFAPPAGHSSVVVVNNGKLFFSEKVRIQAEILVRFGGELRIGRYTVVGYDSEIRCEHQITIGDYGLFSYEVCIFDTNTHSTDWKKRREIIEKMYSYGKGEEERPDTKPVNIGYDVWVGKGATILKGSTIGNRCIVGIRSIVSGGAFEDESLIVSSGSRVIKGGDKSAANPSLI